MCTLSSGEHASAAVSGVPAVAPCGARRAFTLIELLVVIAIIVTLAGMIIAVAGALGIGSKKDRTQAILATTRIAIELTIANRGGSISPAEHPLAGSRTPRAAFIGMRGATWIAGPTPAGTVTPASGANGPLDAISPAIEKTAEWFFNSPAARSQVLADGDIFADKTLPLLYGMKRSSIGIVGTNLEASTAYLRFVLPNPLALIALPYDSTNPAAVAVNPTASAGDDKVMMDYIFGSSNAETELTKLKALYQPPDDLGANRIDQPATIGGLNANGVAFDNAGRVWSAEAASGAGLTMWTPGRIQTSDVDAAGNKLWKLYRLRGPAIYDAFGNEILFSFNSGGGMVLQSAGADGVFRWDPGPNGVLDTLPDATAPAGDDRDGSLDNIVMGVGQ